MILLHEALRGEVAWTPAMGPLIGKLTARIWRALDRRGLLDRDVIHLAAGGLVPRFVYLPRLDSFALVNETGDGFASANSLLGYVTVEEAVDRWLTEHPTLRNVYLTREQARDFRQYHAAELTATRRDGRVVTPGS